MFGVWEALLTANVRDSAVLFVLLQRHIHLHVASKQSNDHSHSIARRIPLRMGGVMKPNEVRKEHLPVSCIGDVCKGVTNGDRKGVLHVNEYHRSLTIDQPRARLRRALANIADQGRSIIESRDRRREVQS
jgi:hypothetical protein